MSSVERIVKMEGVNLNTVVLLFGFFCLEAKYHLTFF